MVDKGYIGMIIGMVIIILLLFWLIALIHATFNADVCIRAGYDAITINMLGQQYCITEITIPISEVLPR